MIVRHIERHEFDESEKIKSIAFARKITTPKNDADDPDAIYPSILGCFDDDGRMMARLRNIDYQCTFDGNILPVTGLSGAWLPCRSRETRGIFAPSSAMRWRRTADAA